VDSRKRWQLMISGVQTALISGWYPIDILDTRLLKSVKTWVFQSIFQVLYSLTSVFWYIPNIQICKADFLKNTLLKSVRYLIEIWSIFCWYPLNIPLISGWNPDFQYRDFREGVTPYGRVPTQKLAQLIGENRIFQSFFRGIQSIYKATDNVFILF